MNKEEIILKLLVINQTLTSTILYKLGFKEKDVIDLINQCNDEYDKQYEELLKGDKQ